MEEVVVTSLKELYWHLSEETIVIVAKWKFGSNGPIVKHSNDTLANIKQQWNDTDMRKQNL